MRGRPDLRLVPGAAGLWAGAWIAPAGPPRAVAAGAAVAAALAAALTLTRRRPSGRAPGAALRATAAAVLALSAAGALAGLAYAERDRAGPLPDAARARASVTVDLTVRSDPRRARPVVRGPERLVAPVVVEARADTVRWGGPGGRRTAVANPVVVYATGPAAGEWARLLPSTRVRAAGRLVPAGGGAVAVFLAGDDAPEVLTGPARHQRVAGWLRDRLRTACSGLSPAARGLLPGLVVGDTTRLPPGLADDFRLTGLAHLTAVSGTNITILLGAAVLALRFAGVRGRLLPLAGAGAVAAFVVLARPEPSVVRAATMGLVTLAGTFTGRGRHGPAALAGAVVLLLLADPALAREYGFALSAAATAALLLVAPRWAAALRRRGWARVPAVAVAAPAAVQAVCEPVAVSFTGRVSLVAVPCNLLAEAAVAPATVLGFVTLLVAGAAPGPASLIARIAELPVTWIAGVARTGARLPGATVPWPDGAEGAAWMAAATVLAVPALRLLVRSRAVVLLLVLALAAILLRPVALVRPLTGWPPPGWHLVACDVGQGDAVVLNAGPGAAVLVDAGPDPAAVDGCLRDLGVRSLPLIVLTHFHADHVEGLPGALRGRAAGIVHTAALPEPAAEAARVRAWVARTGALMTPAPHGRHLAAGDLTWRVVAPRDPGAARRQEGSAPNNASVVLLAERHGVRMLLMGDSEPAAQRDLRAELPGLRADVLKIAHHGSARQDPELLLRARPSVAIVSVGAGNPYGHPAPSLRALLEATGARVARTDRHGAVAVTGRPGALRVVTRRASAHGTVIAPPAARESRHPTAAARESRHRRAAVRESRHRSAVFPARRTLRLSCPPPAAVPGRRVGSRCLRGVPALPRHRRRRRPAARGPAADPDRARSVPGGPGPAGLGRTGPSPGRAPGARRGGVPCLGRWPGTVLAARPTTCSHR